jgi:uncharacterized protein (TIGR02246 family)
MAAETPDQLAIRALLNDGCAAFIAGDAERSVAMYLPSVTVFDIAPPREKDHDQVVAFNKALFGQLAGKPTCVYEEIDPVILTPEYAYSTSILRVSGKLKNGAKFDLRERSTDIYQKLAGHWRVMHEHNSVPVNVFTGQADLLSTP